MGANPESKCCASEFPVEKKKESLQFGIKNTSNPDNDVSTAVFKTHSPKDQKKTEPLGSVFQSAVTEPFPNCSQLAIFFKKDKPSLIMSLWLSGTLPSGVI